jgi:hypothetical protein
MFIAMEYFFFGQCIIFTNLIIKPPPLHTNFYVQHILIPMCKTAYFSHELSSAGSGPQLLHNSLLAIAITRSSSAASSLLAIAITRFLRCACRFLGPLLCCLPPSLECKSTLPALLVTETLVSPLAFWFLPLSAVGLSYKADVPSRSLLVTAVALSPAARSQTAGMRTRISWLRKCTEGLRRSPSLPGAVSLDYGSRASIWRVEGRSTHSLRRLGSW